MCTNICQNDHSYSRAQTEIFAERYQPSVSDVEPEIRIEIFEALNGNIYPSLQSSMEDKPPAYETLFPQK